jgi:formyl-CoA transferase
VRTITEVAIDDELHQRGLIRTGEFTGHGAVNVLGSAIKISGAEDHAIKPRVPQLGEDTDDILAELGVGADEIAILRRDGVI